MERCDRAIGLQLPWRRDGGVGRSVLAVVMEVSGGGGGGGDYNFNNR